jgi:hypothetical protein
MKLLPLLHLTAQKGSTFSKPKTKAGRRIVELGVDVLKQLMVHRSRILNGRRKTGGKTI